MRLSNLARSPLVRRGTCCLVLCLLFSLLSCSGSDSPRSTKSPKPKKTGASTPGAKKPKGGKATWTPPPGYKIDKPKPPDEFTRQKQKGIDLVLSRNYQQAVPVLLKAISLNGRDGESHYYLFVAYTKLEPKPTPSSKSYAEARKTLLYMPEADYAERRKARDFVVAVNLAAGVGPAPIKPDLYRVNEPAILLLSADQQPGAATQKALVDAELQRSGAKDRLPLGVGLDFWVKKTALFDQAAGKKFKVQACYVELLSKEKTGQKGWLVTYLASGDGKSRQIRVLERLTPSPPEAHASTRKGK